MHPITSFLNHKIIQSIFTGILASIPIFAFLAYSLFFLSSVIGHPKFVQERVEVNVKENSEKTLPKSEKNTAAKQEYSKKDSIKESKSI